MDENSSTHAHLEAHGLVFVQQGKTQQFFKTQFVLIPVASNTAILICPSASHSEAKSTIQHLNETQWAVVFMTKLYRSNLDLVSICRRKVRWLFSAYIYLFPVHTVRQGGAF